MTTQERKDYITAGFKAGRPLFCIDRRDTLEEFNAALSELQSEGLITQKLVEIEPQYSRLEVRPTQKLVGQRL